ncbi:MAG: serine protease [Bryobacteraceae bacterium]|nr:serine protease [Bryobacteraceae bacterium]
MRTLIPQTLTAVLFVTAIHADDRIIPNPTRVHLLPKCLVNPPRSATSAGRIAEALAGIFVPKLIEAGLQGVGGALKKAGEVARTQAIGVATTDMYVSNPLAQLSPAPFGCVVAFVEGSSRNEGSYHETTKAAIQALRRAELLPDQTAALWIWEASVLPSDDGTSIQLDTTHLSVAEFLGGRGNEREFVVSLAVATPNSTADGETIAFGNINMGKIRRNEPWQPQEREFRRSNLLPWEKISDLSLAVWKQDAEAGVGARRYMPATVSVTLTETDNGNAFLRKLGEVLSGTSSDTAKVLTSAVLPRPRKERSAAEELEGEKLIAAEEEAWIAYLKAGEAVAGARANSQPLGALIADEEAKKRAWERATRLLKAAGGEPPRRIPPEPPRALAPVGTAESSESGSRSVESGPRSELSPLTAGRVEQKIIGGKPAEPGAWPWQVALIDALGGHQFCGGTLVAPRWVLTAMHCIAGKSEDRIFVRVGVTDLRDRMAGAWRNVVAFERNAQFNPKNLDMDVVLLKLANDVTPAEGVQFAEFVKSDEETALQVAGQPVTTIGWGRTSPNGPTSPILRQVEVAITNFKECLATYANPNLPEIYRVTENMMCAARPQRDSCGGDSGGPLVVRTDNGIRQIGVVSKGRECALENFPGVYTRVVPALEWIKETTQR